MSSAEGNSQQALKESLEEIEKMDHTALFYLDDKEASNCLKRNDKIVIVQPVINRLSDPQDIAYTQNRAAAATAATSIQDGKKRQELQADAGQKNSEKEGRGGGRSATRKWSSSLYAMDCLIAAVITGPLVTAHWRGIWAFMEYHENIFGGWRCFGLGVSLHLVFALARQPLHDKFGRAAADCCSSRVCLRAAHTLYIYLFSLACNFHWRGVWTILERWFGLEAGVIACFTCAVLGDLVLLRCARNLVAPPFVVSRDSAQFIFRFPTMYRLLIDSLYRKCYRAPNSPIKPFRLFISSARSIIIMKPLKIRRLPDT